MKRLLLLLCLPLCLALVPAPPPYPTQDAPPDPPPIVRAALPGETPLVQFAADQGRASWYGALDPVAEVNGDAVFVLLARYDPVGLLEASLRRYDREVKGYTCTLLKRERVQGQPLPPPDRMEEIAVRFREHPFSVFMDWKKNPGSARRVLYVKGEFNDQLLVLPTGLGAFRLWERDPFGPDARRGGRYPLPEFGIRVGTARALASWKQAEAQGNLKVEYLGKEEPPHLGGRVCYVVRRTGYTYARPEDKGVVEDGVTFYFDPDNWLQIGSVLTETGGGLLAEYWFRDLHLNPDFGPDAFSRQAVAGG